MNPNRINSLRKQLLSSYHEDGLWGVKNPAWMLPDGLERGSEEHLTYLTLVYTISGGRAPAQLWQSARETFVADAELFDPHFLAFVRPAGIKERLRHYKLTQKAASEATHWQRIGQALVMRAQGSVSDLLAKYQSDAPAIIEMLQGSKTTFPVLSGKQTAPRWLFGLAENGLLPLTNLDSLLVPASPAAKRAFNALNIESKNISVSAFDAVDTLGRYGCQQRKKSQSICPVSADCPVAQFCKFGQQ